MLNAHVIIARAPKMTQSNNASSVAVYEDVIEDQFMSEIYPQRKPALLVGLDIGPCVQKWNINYLQEHLGEREVKIHVSTTPRMDFVNKNFAYRSLPFHELIQRIYMPTQSNYFFDEKELYYLRSLGDNPRKEVANVALQFPSLSEDLRLPNFFRPEQFFSSVFRISSPGLHLWTHYDIMDNLLLQIQGRKRVVLFSPQDVPYMYLIGDKSRVVDIDNPDLEKYPEFTKATKYECTMNAGDVLFLPALWFHNVQALTPGIAVNVFWRHLDPKYYDVKDVYGNKDLLPASQALQLVDKATKSLSVLPEEYQKFYMLRMISSLQKLTV